MWHPVYILWLRQWRRIYFVWSQGNCATLAAIALWWRWSRAVLQCGFWLIYGEFFMMRFSPLCSSIESIVVIESVFWRSKEGTTVIFEPPTRRDDSKRWDFTARGWHDLELLQMLPKKKKKIGARCSTHSIILGRWCCSTNNVPTL